MKDIDHKGPYDSRDQIVCETEKLTGWFRSTESYRSYIRALSLVKSQEGLFKRLNDYRRESLSLDEGDEDYPGAAQALYESYKDILTKPVVMDFLTAESRIVKKLRIMYDCIARDLDLDLSYMDLQEGGYHD